MAAKLVDEDLKPVAKFVDEEFKPAAKLVDNKELRPVAQKVETKELKPTVPKVYDEEFKSATQMVELIDDMEEKHARGVEELKLVKDIEEMKSKLNQLESKLTEVSPFLSFF